ncbi:MAG: branched-chain amino acid transaminase [Chloroflexi bacterium]|jgi:branched-chain amino acid aminotransferase|nr:branched-chain amino acid transaminase [Chloroflexota bacterium]MBT4514778.1 branched-chain amino acid transaminase [Chloroflexota bacterium]MBT6682611.1 branched-chain amino acid transaminase [Chloroflexota bacterium]
MSPEPYAFLGGKQVPLAEAKVGVMTHALHYGTAVFEGVRGNWNEEHGKMYVFRLREHYERLLRGSSILKIELPYSVDDLIDITRALVERNGYREDVYIRPLAFKSAQLVANLKLHEVESDFTLMVQPFGAYIENDGAIRCQTSSWRRPEDTMMPTGVKLSGLYTTGILAKTEAVMAGFDEAIVMNHDGTVSEGTGENLFLVRDGVLHTPSETDNCLLGITRDCVIHLAREEFGMEVVERRMHRSELYLADEVFLTGTAAHLTAVGELDNRKIGTGEMGPVAEKLQGMYFDIVAGNNPKYMHWLEEVTPSGG